MPIHWNLLMARMMLDRGWMGQVREDADTGKMRIHRVALEVGSESIVKQINLLSGVDGISGEVRAVTPP
jgi:hypothetical protein